MLKNLMLVVVLITLIYGYLYYFLRKVFRQFEKDIALVTLNISAYPVLIVFILGSLKFAIASSKSNLSLIGFNSCLSAAIIMAIAYWLWQLMIDVVFYELKNLAENSEIMWDNVLIPLLEAVTPILIILVKG